MKRVFVSLFLIITTTISCGLSSIASAERFWESPKRIKTYIPKNSRNLMMQHAFARWSKATTNKIIFQYVDKPENAQVVVYFVPVVPNADREIGLTKAQFYNSGEMAKAEIYIAEKTSDGRQLGNDAVFTVMIHEIGHAIGISEHSTDPKSIMYPEENDIQEILSTDIKTLNKIYGWKN